MIELQNQEQEIITLENEGILLYCRQVIYDPITDVCVLIDKNWNRCTYMITKIDLNGDSTFLPIYKREYLYLVKKNHTLFGCVLEDTRLTVLG